ncbi:berberine-like enzyme [Bacillus thuringiensis]|uniref:Berberine-like enzyme n=1 Tax=Bacillus thuringiensis TaxID=1428 RepID=A0A4R4BLU7_BACTU|nr:BBE domain-containing protein [Bacillus thuringiensis]TCW57825.1 berberine-like enzyme [Bacillus thuringiensis]TCW58746.1 berberine-like enzyme [Bacillus thuringiensis]
MSNQKIELTGRIVTPNDPDYNSAREEFNTFFNKFPLIIVFAQNTQMEVKAKYDPENVFNFPQSIPPF